MPDEPEDRARRVAEFDQGDAGLRAVSTTYAAMFTTLHRDGGIPEATAANMVQQAWVTWCQLTTMETAARLNAEAAAQAKGET
jgi:hypothetical protein